MPAVVEVSSAQSTSAAVTPARGTGALHPVSSRGTAVRTRANHDRKISIGPYRIQNK